MSARQLLGQMVEADDRAAEALGEAERARSAWRLATKIVRTPRSASACAVSSLVSPAPMITTWRPPSSPSSAPRARPRPRRGSRGCRRSRSRCARACRRAAPPRTGGWTAARSCRRAARLVGALDLALDLVLADDHRLEARGHAEQLARGVAVARRVDQLGQLGRADPGVAREQARARRPRRAPDRHDEVELGAVAGRDHDRLADLRLAHSAP
jgi:hypothetical protein